DAPFPRERAITSAYLTRRAYLDPRSDASAACVGTRTNGGRTFVVIRVAPHGGIPALLAIDASDHLLASVTERLPIATGVTTYGDYRSVDGLVLPFAISSGTTLEPRNGYVVTVRDYRVRDRVSDADFERPAATGEAVMLGGAASTTVPLTLDYHQLLVWASIDGHAPMPFVLDTGGHAILTVQAAKALGLGAQGAGESGGAGAGTIALQYTRARSIRIGQAELRDQPFLVIPYDYSFYERGKAQPLAGILGLEIFERFAVRIDYAARSVTLAPLATFRYGGGGTALPVTFQDDFPIAAASADGHPGLFGIDTGNAGSLVLFGDFLRKTGLLERYAGGSLVIGHGTGGSNTGRLGTLADLTIGGHHVRDIRTDFTQMTQGAFSSWTEAGNIGFHVLSRFVPTFDYANGTIYLEPEPNPVTIVSNRTGLSFVKNGPDAFDVIAVTPGSVAAAAGVRMGDKIVAVDGKAASAYSFAQLAGILTQPFGTKIALRITHGDAPRTIVLQLP
ncbi:MAG TPA: aspartyl protease family protein, partial [Candidatus Acidoferrales bacterium]|nr:aspartyl protease family protein [Candidatus Acidoferrales bacterium]